MGKTASAKLAVKNRQLAEMTLEEKMMLPLYLHYRSLELTKILKATVEQRPNSKNS
ncbi:hypothetical protein [Turneriella parva]|uniref:Uncharacterized protein n=1 Tax=Turneriella parva (strain ATCC BAA-1111 / DSM 21527 / NCTC 11395 / H) TaxID=869212 RepID=I4B2M6_TURPD|nr:hypothetical protein [Turneriella parva]AFM11533.1 hypothetical protein Turpa_0882 [Turneriella parva DSM 21527]